MSAVTALGRPGCPGCGGPPATERGLLFCGVCWTDVPAPVRKRLDTARKALGRNPAAPKVVEAFERALNEAVRYVQ